MMELLDHYLPVFKQLLQMTSDPVAFDNYAECRQTCINRLEQAIHDAGLQDVSEEEKEAAQVAVIAWLDETVLCSGLSWRQRWQSELLQRKYLNLSVAGERFFTLLAQLDPTYMQARMVFLFSLQHGFHGQYSTPADHPALQAVIAEQRSRCLPESWQIWPNEAPVTPCLSVQSTTMSQHRHAWLRMALCVSMLYGVLFFFLLSYVS